jgi:hypothetical protein
MWTMARTKPPIPAISPIRGTPLRLDAIANNTTPNTIPGRKTATMALPTPPAFLPPTNPATSGPKRGSQNKSNEIKNIQTIALPTLPLFWLSMTASVSQSCNAHSRSRNGLTKWVWAKTIVAANTPGETTLEQ